MRTASGSLALSAMAKNGAAARGSFNTPRPRAAKARVSCPSPESRASNTGTARASLLRCSANAIGHQRLRACPVPSINADESASYDPSRTNAYAPSRTASTAGGFGVPMSSALMPFSTPADRCAATMPAMAGAAGLCPIRPSASAALA